MAPLQTPHAVHPQGIRYVAAERGHRTAAMLTLEQWGDLWEELLDVPIAAARGDEARVPWEDIEANLDADGRPRCRRLDRA